MSLHAWTAVGLAAAALTSTSFIPQIFAQLRNPEHTRVSYGTLGAFLLGSALWIGYGLHLRDWIIIGANLFVASNLAFLFVLQAGKDFTPGKKGGFPTGKESVAAKNTPDRQSSGDVG